MTHPKLTDIHRRRFLALSASAAAVPSLPSTGWAIGSETHSSMIGDVELTVLSDGSLTLPSGALAPAAPREEFEALLTRTMGSLPDTVETRTKSAVKTQHSKVRFRAWSSNTGMLNQEIS